MTRPAPERPGGVRTGLVALIVLETVALLVCAALFALRDDAGTRAGTGGTSSETKTRSATREARTGADGSAPAAASVARREATDAERPGDRALGLLIYGRITDTDGQPVEDCFFEIHHADGTLAARGYQRDPEGYAVPGFAPGSYTLTADSPSHLRGSASAVLDGSTAGARCDLELVAAPKVTVYARFEDGETFSLNPKSLGVRSSNVSWHMQPRVSETPFGTRHHAFPHGRQEGVQWSPHEPMPDGALGLLTVDRPLPQHAALCLTSEVLATAVLPAGAERLDFTVPRERFEGLAASARVTVRDARTDAPLPGAQVSVAEFQGPTDDSGRALIERLLPGLHTFRIESEGRAAWQQAIDLPPGSQTELEVRLHPLQKIRGRVLDHNGDPVGGVWIRSIPLRTTELPPTAWLESAAVCVVQEDGSFDMEIASEPHILRFDAHAPGRATGHAVVDPSRIGDEVVEIVARQGVALRLQTDGYAFRAVVVRDALGVAQAWTQGATALSRRVMVPPGPYTLWIHDFTGLLSTQPLEVPAGVRGLSVDIR